MVILKCNRSFPVRLVFCTICTNEWKCLNSQRARWVLIIWQFANRLVIYCFACFSKYHYKLVILNYKLVFFKKEKNGFLGQNGLKLLIFLENFAKCSILQSW
jgi:hypothetical protein